MRKAVFIDRDGTIIDDTGYLGDPGRVFLLPGAAEALRLLGRNGYLVLVVTNQSGIARGYFKEGDAVAVNLRMIQILDGSGAHVDGVYYCPHHPEEGCGCRKPGGLMIDRASADFEVDLEDSWVVGDTDKDVLLGIGKGLRSILVKTGEKEKGRMPAGVPLAEDLLDAAHLIVSRKH